MSLRRLSEPVRITYIHYRINIPKKQRNLKKSDDLRNKKLYYLNGMQHKDNRMKHPWYQLSKKHERKLPPLALIRNPLVCKEKNYRYRNVVNREKYFSFSKDDNNYSSCSISLDNEMMIFYSPLRTKLPSTYNFPLLRNHQRIVFHDLVKKFHWILNNNYGKQDNEKFDMLKNNRDELYQLRESYAALDLNDLCNNNNNNDNKKKNYFRFDVSDLENSRMRKKLRDISLINTALRKKNKNHLLIVNYFRSGLILENLKKYKKAIKSYEQVLLLSRKRGISTMVPIKRYGKEEDNNNNQQVYFNFKSHVFCQIGCCFQILYLNNPKNQDYFNLALLFHKKMLDEGDCDENGKAISLCNQGLTYLYSFNTKKALELFLEGLNMLKKNKKDEKKKKKKNDYDDDEKKIKLEYNCENAIMNKNKYESFSLRVKLVIISNIVLCLIAQRDLDQAMKILHQIFMGNINDMISTKKIQTSIVYFLLGFIHLFRGKAGFAREYFALAYRYGRDISSLKELSRVCYVRTKVMEAESIS